MVKLNKPFLVIVVVMLLQGVFLMLKSTPLDDYIEEGMINNLTLRQKNISYQRALASLKLAKSYFYPTIELNGSVVSGEGGRSIDFPVGDMLNPVYSTLNYLTKTNAFPQIDNVSINYMPNEYYDTKLHTTIPIINTDLHFNKDIQTTQAEIKSIEIYAYRKELVKSIKVAYYSYLSALSQQNIYENALGLAREGKRVNESLLKNGVNLPAYVLRSESEIQSINAKIEESNNQIKLAKRYFNFLLNKNLESDIAIDDSIISNNSFITKNFEISKPENREEMKILSGVVDLNKSIVTMKSNYWVPTVNGFADLGLQDDKFKFSRKSEYYMLGLQVNMPIFDFFKGAHKTEEAEMDLESAEINYTLTKSKLELTMQRSVDDLETAKANFLTAEKQWDAASAYYNLIDKGYREGKNTFIEMIDARNQYTNSEILKNINKYRVLIQIAECEREINN